MPVTQAEHTVAWPWTGAPGGAITAHVPEGSAYERARLILAGTPTVLAAIVTGLPLAALDERPASEAWSPRQVLSHLLTTERDTIGPRLRRVAQRDGLPALPSAPTPPPGDPQSMLAEWAAERQRNLAWLATVSAEQRTHADVHPRHGRITLEEHVVEWSYHDLDHLRQILGALGAELYPHLGAWQTLYEPPR
jgi:hypothetical protein